MASRLRRLSTTAIVSIALAVGPLLVREAAASPAESAAEPRERTVDVMAGFQGSYQPYNGPSDFTPGGWAGAMFRGRVAEETELGLGFRVTAGALDDPFDDEDERTTNLTASVVARSALCGRWACIGIGLELGVARVSTRTPYLETATRTKGLFGIPVSLHLGRRSPFAFMAEAGPRFRLGTDFYGQEPGDGGYKSARGWFVGLGVAYSL